MAGSINRFLFTRIMKHFPSDTAFVFAYGSGVFQQMGNSNPDNMIDFVFAVDHSKDWHAKNLERNPQHYSGLKIFGPRAIAAYQERLGAGAYYNTLVKCEKRLVKYGIIQTDCLIKDLNDWDQLYISGRLHKPVHVVKRDSNKDLFEALQNNLKSALRTALLLLPERFTSEQLFHTIAGLSYHGDFRMTFGENKNKVDNIVGANLEHFQEYYKPYLGEFTHLHWNSDKSWYEQGTSPAIVFNHLKRLPSHLQRVIVTKVDKKTRDVEEVLGRISEERNHAELVNEGVKGIVTKSSRSQSIKAIFAAGIVKTIKYSGQKILKMQSGGPSKR
ncbi:Phosphatidate cytidylyltransferase, mitochondrial [Holothuria leucospilota]|uniref:Phosphatidate cytidylyltransferase, mitochondrial n=1 Tax=Holothuria leucospilota TaxID=206669 RepID=A0A9Q1CKA2_HOLLE|nr:Phosphatidate cytidylyltransferase, mitochondrial [Holothuria leucospilota]